LAAGGNEKIATIPISHARLRRKAVFCFFIFSVIKSTPNVRGLWGIASCRIEKCDYPPLYLKVKMDISNSG